MAIELEYDVLDDARVAAALKNLPGWEQDGPAIRKQYSFDSFMEAVAFVNRVAATAEHINHHPDIIVNYKKVTIRFWTHKKNATTGADVYTAAEVDKVA